MPFCSYGPGLGPVATALEGFHLLSPFNLRSNGGCPLFPSSVSVGARHCQPPILVHGPNPIHHITSDVYEWSQALLRSSTRCLDRMKKPTGGIDFLRRNSQEGADESFEQKPLLRGVHICTHCAEGLTLPGNPKEDLAPPLHLFLPTCPRKGASREGDQKKNGRCEGFGDRVLGVNCVSCVSSNERISTLRSQCCAKCHPCHGKRSTSLRSHLHFTIPLVRKIPPLPSKTDPIVKWDWFV
jgi:hypothetical protein